MILDEGNCLRDQTLKVCSFLENFNNNHFKGSSLETLRQMGSIDEGITLVSEIACKKDDNVQYIEFDASNFYREIDLVIGKSAMYGELFWQIGNIIAESYNLIN